MTTSTMTFSAVENNINLVLETSDGVYSPGLVLAPSYHDLEHLHWGLGFSRPEEAEISGAAAVVKRQLNLPAWEEAEVMFSAMGIDYGAFTKWLDAYSSYAYDALPVTFWFEGSVLKARYNKRPKVKPNYPRAFGFTRDQLLGELRKQGVYAEDLLDDLYYGYDRTMSLVVAAGYRDDYYQHTVNYCLLAPCEFGRSFRDVEMVIAY